MAITNEELMREVNRRSIEATRTANARRVVLARNPTVNYTNGFIALAQCARDAVAGDALAGYLMRQHLAAVVALQLTEDT